MQTVSWVVLHMFNWRQVLWTRASVLSAVLPNLLRRRELVPQYLHGCVRLSHAMKDYMAVSAVSSWV